MPPKQQTPVAVGEISNTPISSPRTSEEGAVGEGGDSQQPQQPQPQQPQPAATQAEDDITEVRVYRKDLTYTKYSEFSDPTVGKYDANNNKISEVSAGGGRRSMGGSKKGGKKSRKPKSKKRRVRKTRRRKH